MNIRIPFDTLIVAEAEFTQDIEYGQSLTVRKYPPVARHLSLLLFIEAYHAFRGLQQLFVQIEQARDAVAVISRKQGKTKLDIRELAL